MWNDLFCFSLQSDAFVAAYKRLTGKDAHFEFHKDD